MYLPLGESPAKLEISRAGARSLVGVLCLAFAGVFLFAFSVHAACSNPSPLPSGYASPCPVFSVSPLSVSPSQTLTLSASPQPGTDYIYTTAYYAKGSTWLPVTLTGNNAAPSYSTGPANGSLNASILASLPLGTNYVVLWDWLWDATAQCYKGPGLNQCNTGMWRLQTFTISSSVPSAYTITVNLQGTGSGTVVSNSGRLSCPPTCSVLFNTGITITLTATAAAGSNFTGWSGCPAPAGAICAIAVNSDLTLTANFGGTAISPTPTPTPTANCTSNCFYISAAGSDANAGTSAAAPWKTFAFAIPKLLPGYTLNLLNGTYNSSNSGFPQINCSTTAHNGTPSAPITIQSLNERQAFIQGDSSGGTYFDPFFMYQCSYWNIYGLHVEDGDFSGQTGSDGVMAIFQGAGHINVKRNIIARSNRYANAHDIVLDATSNNLVEENETYYCHRDCIVFYGGANNNEARRNYANNRGYNDISGGRPAGGTGGIVSYYSSGVIFENNIMEDAQGGSAFDSEAVAPDNMFLGNIARNSNYGFRSSPHTGDPSPTNNNLINNVSINAAYVGFWNRSSNGYIYDHDSAFGGSSSMGFEGDSTDVTSPGTCTHSSTITNSLANSVNTGYLIVTNGACWTWSYDHDTNFGNGTSYNPNTNVTNANSSNPAFGSCYLWVPASSPLKGAGSGGSDIGANILYAYSGGNLTNTKLWNTDGSFAGKGAIVAGLNDVAGSSLFDIQNRLNVNKNGCVFPTGY